MEIKYKNKKAMIFTILTLTLLSLFILSYSIYHNLNDRNSINKRVETMNSFVNSLEKDISRQAYISVYRAIISLQNYMTSEGKFLTNVGDSMEEVILNGSVNNISINLMEGYTLPDINSKISVLGDKMNLEINYSLYNFSIIQENPWFVKIILDVNILVKDKTNRTYWNKTETISSEIEITNFEDPLYLINTNGLVSNKFKKTNYIPFTEGTNVSNLTYHVGESYYIASNSGPSFLKRFEGKTEADPNGIESLINLSKLSSQGITVNEKSVVDYIYFSDNNPVSYKIQNMPSWFRIDNESSHLEIYNVKDLIIQ